MMGTTQAHSCILESLQCFSYPNSTRLMNYKAPQRHLLEWKTPPKRSSWLGWLETLDVRSVSQHKCKCFIKITNCCEAELFVPFTEEFNFSFVIHYKSLDEQRHRCSWSLQATTAITTHKICSTEQTAHRHDLYSLQFKEILKHGMNVL